MNEFQLPEETRTQNYENPKPVKHRQTMRPRKISRVRTKAPAASNPELPILLTLSKCPTEGVRARDVLQEVRSAKWFGMLNNDDRRARYPESRKKIVDTVIKFAKKNLVIKGEMYPVGEGTPVGIWRITT